MVLNCIVAFITVFYFTSTVHGFAPIHPQNTAALVGSAVNLTCRSKTSSIFRWYHFPPNNTTQVLVFTGSKMNSRVYGSRFSVTFDNITGESTLTIVDLSLSDAGVYLCYEITTSTSQKSIAELIVLGSHPNCLDRSSLERSNEMEMTSDWQQWICFVEYRGNWAPSLRCSLPLTTNETEELTTNQSYVMLTHKFLSTTEFHKYSLSCKLFFNASTWRQVINDQMYTPSGQTPAYIHEWVLSSMNATHPARNTQITYETILNTTSSRLARFSCRSEGNPPPTYEWFNVRTGENRSGPQYVVDLCDVMRLSSAGVNDAPEYNETLICVAQNVAGRGVQNRTFLLNYGNLCDSLGANVEAVGQFTTFPPASDAISAFNIVTIVLLVVIIVVIIISVIIVSVSMAKLRAKLHDHVSRTSNSRQGYDGNMLDAEQEGHYMQLSHKDHNAHIYQL